MWLEKIFYGVLRVLTPLGPRYVKPTFTQRLYLLWLFRNFPMLPVKVLSSRQQKLIDQLCAAHGFVSLVPSHGTSDVPLLGTLEQRPPMEPQIVAGNRSPQTVSGTVSPFAADQHRP
jgi:hypothetical protein